MTAHTKPLGDRVVEQLYDQALEEMLDGDIGECEKSPGPCKRLVTHIIVIPCGCDGFLCEIHAKEAREFIAATPTLGCRNCGIEFPSDQAIIRPI